MRQSKKLLILTLGSVLAHSAHADTYWTCNDGNWNNTGCWSLTSLPTLADWVLVEAVAPNTRVNINDVTGNAYAGSLHLNSTGTNSVTLYQTGGNLTVGLTGIGENAAFTQSGGIHSAEQFFMGSVHGTSNYNLSDTGTLITGYTSIGNDGVGVFTMNGGAHTVNGAFTLGYNSGSSGTYILNNGNLSAIDLKIGDQGTGTFIQRGGTHTVSRDLFLGVQGGSSGSYELSGGELNVGTEIIGYAGTGSRFTQSGGVHRAAFLGVGFIANGSYDLSGTGILSVDDEFIGGSYGRGSFNQSGGTHTVASRLVVDGDNNSTGTGGSYILSGNGSLSAATEIIGYDGNGASFTQSGGTHTVNELILGLNSGSSGSYTLNNGNLSVTQETIGRDGTGTFIQTGGIHTAADIYIGGGSTFTHNGGALIVSGNIVNGFDGTFNVGAGATTIVNGDAFLNSGLLRGAGTVAGNVFSDGTVGPGESLGALGITGDYQQFDTGIFSVEIGGLLSGSEYNVLNVTGTASLAGTLVITLTDLGSGLFAPQAGDSFDILTADILQGSFSSLSFASLLDPSLSWQLEYFADALGSTDVLRLSVVQAVPVPASLWLFGAGLCGLVGIARRKAT